MNKSLPLQEMTLAEKISAMEALWDDLCRSETDALSPAWHEELLRQREKDIAIGASRFVDWNEAKKRIRDALP